MPGYPPGIIGVAYGFCGSMGVWYGLPPICPQPKPGVRVGLPAPHRVLAGVFFTALLGLADGLISGGLYPALLSLQSLALRLIIALGLSPRCGIGLLALTVSPNSLFLFLNLA